MTPPLSLQLQGGALAGLEPHVLTAHPSPACRLLAGGRRPVGLPHLCACICILHRHGERLRPCCCRRCACAAADAGVQMLPWCPASAAAPPLLRPLACLAAQPTPGCSTRPPCTPGMPPAGDPRGGAHAARGVWGQVRAVRRRRKRGGGARAQRRRSGPFGFAAVRPGLAPLPFAWPCLLPHAPRYAERTPRFAWALVLLLVVECVLIWRFQPWVSGAAAATLRCVRQGLAGAGSMPVLLLLRLPALQSLARTQQTVPATPAEPLPLCPWPQAIPIDTAPPMTRA